MRNTRKNLKNYAKHNASGCVSPKHGVYFVLRLCFGHVKWKAGKLDQVTVAEVSCADASCRASRVRLAELLFPYALPYSDML